jgi:hypothetical protein
MIAIASPRMKGLLSERKMFFEAPKADRLRPGKNSDDAKTGLDTKSGGKIRARWRLSSR